LVVGLDVFGAHFSGYQDRYVLIGGAACFLAMTEAGLDFRSTRDLDIVLCVEALDSNFVAAFWDFIRKGGYRCRERSTGIKKYYRFHKPEVFGYPHMLELFSRVPDSLSLPGTSRLTPIPAGQDLSSLSAILLDDDYYHYLMGGRMNAHGLSFIGPEHLLPLKAKAWLDLSKRRLQGEDINKKELRKHKNDVFRLFPILNPSFGGKVPDTIRCDLREFLARMETETVDLKSLGLKSTTQASILADIKRVFSLNQ
jgi:hypothetical protein